MVISSVQRVHMLQFLQATKHLFFIKEKSSEKGMGTKNACRKQTNALVVGL